MLLVKYLMLPIHRCCVVDESSTRPLTPLLVRNLARNLPERYPPSEWPMRTKPSLDRPKPSTNSYITTHRTRRVRSQSKRQWHTATQTLRLSMKKSTGPSSLPSECFTPRGLGRELAPMPNQSIEITRENIVLSPS
jgi:hypothetical protein